MAFFDELGKKISKTGADAAQKAKNMAETVKLNGLISDEEKRIKDLWTQIGKQYCETFGESPDPALAAYVADIKQASANIDSYEADVRRIKGVITCDNCGGAVSSTAPFCSTCGSPVKVLAPPAPAGVNVCANCGTHLSYTQAFCTGCGSKVVAPPPPPPEVAEVEVHAMCVNCGYEAGPDVVFCLNCGTKLQ